MSDCFFVSDLHGSISRYQKLFTIIAQEKPSALFIGGDILPSGMRSFVEGDDDFLENVIIRGFKNLKNVMLKEYPEVFIILGNDDGKSEEKRMISADREGVWNYIHNRKIFFRNRFVYGYSYIPPTPFLFKDWEKYDVSRYTDPGSVSPEAGKRTYHIEPNIVRYSTISKDLDLLFGKDDLENALLLFHSPPYKTKLDRAALDGKSFEYVPLDVHVGSIAVRNLIEEKQPHITMHGHIHESASITGSWMEKLGETCMISGCHDGNELAVVKFDINDPCSAVRVLY